MRPEDSELNGVILERSPLRARVVGNSPRLLPLIDTVKGGMNGLASLIHDEQNKNIFATCGMNLEGCRTDPSAGAVAGQPQAPRHGPMAVQRVSETGAVLTQNAQEGAGLNFEISFSLGDSCVDQTIVTWPDDDIQSSHHFYASYMNQVQNTSLFLRGRLEGEDEIRWLEATSPGHGGDGAVFFRPVDLEGKAWHELLRDNPVRRQKRFRDEESIAAARDAGFRPGKLSRLEPFFFGLVDDFMVLYMFRGGKFAMWISSSGAMAVRSPAWDYMINDGPQAAGEQRSYYVRLLYTRYDGVDKVLNAVEQFRSLT